MKGGCPVAFHIRNPVHAEIIRDSRSACPSCLNQTSRSLVERARRLRRWLRHHPIRAMPPGRLYRTRKFLRRNRLASALTGLTIVTVGVAMLSMGWQARQTARESERNLQIKDQLIQLFLQPEDPQYGTGRKTVAEFLDQAVVRLQNLPLGNEVRGELVGMIVGIYNQLGLATLAENHPLMRELATAEKRRRDRDLLISFPSRKMRSITDRTHNEAVTQRNCNEVQSPFRIFGFPPSPLTSVRSQIEPTQRCTGSGGSALCADAFHSLVARRRVEEAYSTTRAVSRTQKAEYRSR